MAEERNTENLTIEEAYRAMYQFLEGYYYRLNKPDLLAVLLGGFRLRNNGYTVDPAAWTDWLEAVETVLGEGSVNGKATE